MQSVLLSYFNSDYANDLHYCGNGFSKEANLGRLISVADIGAQVLQCPYGICSFVISQGSYIYQDIRNRSYDVGPKVNWLILKIAFKILFQVVYVLNAIINGLGIVVLLYSLSTIIYRLTLIALDILGIAFPEISRIGRRINVNLNDVMHNFRERILMPRFSRSASLKELGFAENQAPNYTEIKQARDQLALKYHPDKPTANADRMQKINEAYEILSKSATFQDFVQDINPYIYTQTN